MRKYSQLTHSTIYSQWDDSFQQHAGKKKKIDRCRKLKTDMNLEAQKTPAPGTSCAYISFRGCTYRPRIGSADDFYLW